MTTFCVQRANSASPSCYSKTETPTNRIQNTSRSLGGTGTSAIRFSLPAGIPSTKHSNPLTQTVLYSDIRKYGDFGGEYHCDHSFEANPPAYTMLRMIRTPPAGGDTIFTSQTALYDKLSPTFQKLCDGLHAVHSSEVSWSTRTDHMETL
jgi:alpha-ketoglutarate-dependent taurine dioxygenase